MIVMKLISVNVAMPQEVEINGKSVSTGIYKEPVAGSVHVGKLTLEGDGQADLSVHGGEFQAAYSYPIEHYAHWQEVLGDGPFSPGMFGENLTVSGFLEDEVFVGDVWRVGGAVLQVTAPRVPCFKFGHKIGRPTILKEFLHSGRSGFYHRVIEEGAVRAGDGIEVLEKDSRGISVRQLLGLQKLGEGDAGSLKRVLEMDFIPAPVRRELEGRLAKY